MTRKGLFYLIYKLLISKTLNPKLSLILIDLKGKLGVFRLLYLREKIFILFIYYVK